MSLVFAALTYRDTETNKLTHRFVPIGALPVIEEAFRCARRHGETENVVGQFLAMCAEMVGTYSPLLDAPAPASGADKSDDEDEASRRHGAGREVQTRRVSLGDADGMEHRREGSSTRSAAPTRGNGK